MPDTYTIERNIPVHAEAGRRGRPTSALGQVIRKMQPGESVVVPSSSARSTAVKIARDNGLKVVTRREGDGFRVWRVEG